MKQKFSKLSLVSVILCAVLTVLFTSFPLTDQQRALISGRDKLIHATVFALLTVCVARALAGSLQGRIRVLILTAVLVLVFSSIDELAQRHVPTRTVDLWDWLANCLGITIGLIAYTLIAVSVSAFLAKAGNDIGRSVEE